ncbi:hypothetical protein IWW34DRAFT_381800 [Fusarium oxysporum f. sp. albedinis]|nr:hypothetical protein IWW34DRAFT_381800 [Fusarium oxysporum f. sp. albedinis]
MLIKRYDSPEVKKLQKLSNYPSQHASHGLTTKLVSTVEEIPADMKDSDFEDWLWSEKKCDNQQFIHFRDEAAFPTFENLPDEDNVDLDFFQTEDGISYRPWRHWAFLGEIISAEFLFGPRLLVKDRRGQQIPIAFYTSQVGRGHSLGAQTGVRCRCTLPKVTRLWILRKAYEASNFILGRHIHTSDTQYSQ